MTTSSFCNFEPPQCVDVQGLDGEQIFVRSTERPVVSVWFTREEWQSFIDGVKAGEFDLLPCQQLVAVSQLDQE
jgi:ABC-type amino acid transport substrate-binding protein